MRTYLGLLLVKSNFIFVMIEHPNSETVTKQWPSLIVMHLDSKFPRQIFFLRFISDDRGMDNQK